MNIAIIPAHYFQIPVARDTISWFYKGINRSIAADQPNIPNEASLVSQTINLITESKSTDDFESIVLIFVAITLGMVVRYIFSNKTLAKDLYKTTKNFFQSSSKVSSYIFVILSTLFVTQMLWALFIDAPNPSFDYFLTYLLDTLNPTNISRYLKIKAFVRLSILINTYFAVIFGFFTFIHKFLNEVENFIDFFSNKDIQTDKAKILLPIIMLLNIFVATAVDVSSQLAFFVISFIVFIYVSKLVSKKKPLNKLYTTREKSQIMLCALCVVFLGLTYKSWINSSKKYYREDLFGVSDRIIFLPYEKKHGEDVTFKDFYINPEYSVFVGDYLVYSPDFEHIINRNLEKYDNSNSYVILGTNDINSLIQKALKSEELKKALIQENFNDIFYLEEEMKQEQVYMAKIYVDCTTNVEPFNLRVSRYTLDSNKNLKKKDFEIFHFVQCADEGLSGLKKVDTKVTQIDEYEVPLLKSVIDKQPHILVLKGVKNNVLLGFEIYENSEKVEVKYLRDLDKDIVLKNENEEETTLYVYSADIEEDYEVINDAEEIGNDKGFNLGKAAADLKKEGLVDNPFKIWTDAGPVIIENKFMLE